MHLIFQNYDTSESKLRREFELYGPIKKVNYWNYFCILHFILTKFCISFRYIVVTLNKIYSKPRGYALSTNMNVICIVSN